MDFERIIVVRDKTRLERLIERFNSKEQARFYIERTEGNFQLYIDEHETFYEGLNYILNYLNSNKAKYKILDRSYLATYIFAQKDIILVYGQDGLLANTAKYVMGLPIIGVNPDEEQYNSILLEFAPQQISAIFNRVNKHQYDLSPISMAKATLNDGQTLLAFNDFYIGCKSHVSSRYSITYKDQTELQSSSGIIVSTGAGATGWLSSILNMTNAINHYYDIQSNHTLPLNRGAHFLMFTVREPFIDRHSLGTLSFGMINKGEVLTISSKMATNGVIFSDGIEHDFLNFNTGSQVQIGVAQERASIII